MSEWVGGSTLKKASAVRRGDLVSVNGYWLEVLRINPTASPQGLLEFVYLNGRSITYRPTEEVLILDM